MDTWFDNSCTKLKDEIEKNTRLFPKKNLKDEIEKILGYLISQHGPEPCIKLCLITMFLRIFFLYIYSNVIYANGR